MSIGLIFTGLEGRASYCGTVSRTNAFPCNREESWGPRLEVSGRWVVALRQKDVCPGLVACQTNCGYELLMSPTAGAFLINHFRFHVPFGVYKLDHILILWTGVICTNRSSRWENDGAW